MFTYNSDREEFVKDIAEEVEKRMLGMAVRAVSGIVVTHLAAKGYEYLKLKLKKEMD